ncbi:MAG: class I SAM-dependent methyltransferase [Pseudomonadales bacterium]|nr:class I SAM-dependent methyltransferase [Halieaceae bacterium]MCP5189590.1 class I SAM-dependent methyltransferase [Pseudomonadales bacterium]MCP5204824.1 class I SAM-dependent methyltransferase [Pseudomonadales bacterium]
MSGAALAVVVAREQDSARGADLAMRLGLPLLGVAAVSQWQEGDYAALLLLDGEHLALQALSPVAADGRRARGALPGQVSAEFGGRAMRHRRRGGQNELLGRAVGVSARLRPHVLDATAGLGRDSFVLADLGCTVTLCEREPVLAALLEYALAAALGSEDDWLVGVARRMRLFPSDARACRAPAQVIYLDPMFPPRDKSAAVKKEMALLQWLLESETGQSDAAQLLAWALEQDVARVVVKRPARAQPLAGAAPSHCLQGKAVRFDVYVRRSLG